MAQVDPEESRRRVEAEQARVQGLIRDVGGEVAEAVASEEPAEVADPGATGTETFEKEKDLAILESLERELAELEAALERIDSGTYGIDEVTGEPIAPERLEAMPAARTNVDTGVDPERRP